MIEIYYIEDDPDIAEAVAAYLLQQGIRVFIYPTMAEAKQALSNRLPDLVCIDRNLPDGSGEELCRWLRRRQGYALPVLYLTVQGEADAIVSGFQDGADDYVVKPFDLAVLHSRILALLRRAGQQKSSVLQCDGIRLDAEKKAVFLEGQELSFSQQEYELLFLLLRNQGRTLTRKQLLAQLWDSNGNFVNDNTLTVTMKRLREKLHHPACIKTIRSFGYRMEETL